MCNKSHRRAKFRVSRAKGTLFDNIKILMPQVFYLMYAYAQKYSYDETIREDFSEREQCLSTSTISNWFNQYREAVVKYQKHQQSMKGHIGGMGKVVQVHASQFSKRKNKESGTRGLWILGMIEDGNEDLRLEACTSNILSAEVMLPLIKKHVAEGTTIITDTSQVYDDLGDNGYIHRKMNHSYENNHTVGEKVRAQRIQSHSQWCAVKRFLSKDSYSNNSSNMDNLIYKYLWRREVKMKREDPFEELIHVINHSYKNHNPPLFFATVE